MLSVIRSVVQPDDKPASTASPAEGHESGSDTEPPSLEPPGKAPDNEGYTDVPFHKHPRFQELLGRVKATAADATRYQNIQGFLDQHGLGAAEAAEALVVAGLMKTNPAAAWERLKPAMQRLLQAAGEILPPDLETRVQTGELSREVAFEVSRSRAQIQSVQARQQFEQRQFQDQQVRQQTQVLVDTAQAWAVERHAKDPAFGAKEPLLMDAIAGLQRREGLPATPDGVRDQLKRAYEIVNARYVPPASSRSPVRPVGGGIVGSVHPTHASVLDIVRAGRTR